MGRTFMGRKKAVAARPAAAETGAGPSKYEAVKRLVEAQPDISRADIVSRLRAEGIDVSIEIASSYASKIRRELGTGKRRKRKGKQRRMVAATTSESTPSPAKPAAIGISTDDVVELVNIVKKVGAEEVVRLVQAIK
jgi:hypothetical protein